jgi:hypothetical protein
MAGRASIHASQALAAGCGKGFLLPEPGASERHLRGLLERFDFRRKSMEKRREKPFQELFEGVVWTPLMRYMILQRN